MTGFKNSLLLAAVFALLAIAGTAVISRQAVAQNPNAGAAPVSLVGPLPLPVKSTDSLRPFQTRMCIGPSSGCASTPGTFQVGAERLVVEQVTGGCFAQPTMTGLILGILTTVGGTEASHRLSISPGFGLGPEVSQLTKIYADPNSVVRLGISGGGGDHT